MRILSAEDMRQALDNELVGADYAQFAVAFVSTKGLSMISAALEKILLEGNGLEFIIGLDGQHTEPDAVEELFNVSFA